MSVVEAIILGVIQGITEFLPVSSSGHLELAQALFGNQNNSEGNLLFTIVVHGATALATIVVFRSDVWSIVRGLFQFTNNESAQFSLRIVLSMIPAALIGYFFEDTISSQFFGNTLLVGLMLWITAGLLYITDKSIQNRANVSLLKAWWIGIAQAFAILPGISRSGATIAISLLLGVARDRAARGRGPAVKAGCAVADCKLVKNSLLRPCHNFRTGSTFDIFEQGDLKTEAETSNVSLL